MFPNLAVLGAPVAQLDRASDYGSEGLGFDSLRVYHFFLITISANGFRVLNSSVPLPNTTQNNNKSLRVICVSWYQVCEFSAVRAGCRGIRYVHHEAFHKTRIHSSTKNPAWEPCLKWFFSTCFGLERGRQWLACKVAAEAGFGSHKIFTKG